MNRITPFTDKMFNRPGHISQLLVVGAIIVPSIVERRAKVRRRVRGRGEELERVDEHGEEDMEDVKEKKKEISFCG